jgi:hypothetical protein
MDWTGHGPFTVDDMQEMNADEELNILYADWESDWEIFEDENTTIPICLECGNPLTRWSIHKYAFTTTMESATVLFCEVCR